MRQFISVLALCAISLMSPMAARSQTLNPAYLSEMPSPARIVAEIKGKDAEDSGERQMGAFKALVKIISDMANGLGHRSEYQLTPDEQRITLAYQTAYADVWHKVKDTYGKQYAGNYDLDRDLLVELLDKFFSASFRTQYLRVNGFAAAWYNKVHSNNGNVATSGGGESPNVNTGSASNPVARPVPATDPSIAKARAANVDTTVYGLQMGEPLRLPLCPEGAGTPGHPPQVTCKYQEDALDKVLAKIIAPRPGNEPTRNPHENSEAVLVHNGPVLSVLLYDGVVVSVHLDTGGIDRDPEISKQLREKYGPPTLVKPFTYTPRIGNTLRANDLEWRLPGIHVDYKAVLKKENSSEVIIDSGSIDIETEAAYQRRLAKEKEKEKSRTKM